MTLEQFHYLVDNTSSYGILDLVDATKSTTKLSGQTHVFTTAIDGGPVRNPNTSDLQNIKIYI